MRSRPVSVRGLLAASALGLLVCTVAATVAAWKVDQGSQRADRTHRFADVASYVHRTASQATDGNWVPAFAARLASDQIDAELTLDAPGQERHLLFASPDLFAGTGSVPSMAAARNAALAAQERTTTPRAVYAFALGPARPGAVLMLGLWAHPLDGTRSALAAAAAGLTALLAALAFVVLVATRWIVRPLRQLSAQVDAIAGGEVAAGPPPSRLREIRNIAAAVSGMGQTLRAAAERDARLDAQRRFMVSAAAHDLRTPLFALRGYLEAIATGIGPAGQQLERARAKAAQLEGLVAGLFVHARADLGEPPRLETVDLLDAVRKAALGFELAAAQRRVHLRIAGDGIAAEVDRERFERVIANVLDNAVRHTCAGGTVEVTVGWDPCGTPRAAFVRVADTGPGVPADVLPHIFEPMIGGDHPEPRGTGLGLAIAAHLMESQHGTIAVESRPGRGTAFTMRLRSPRPVRVAGSEGGCGSGSPGEGAGTAPGAA